MGGGIGVGEDSVTPRRSGGVLTHATSEHEGCLWLGCWQRVRSHSSNRVGLCLLRLRCCCRNAVTRNRTICSVARGGGVCYRIDRTRVGEHFVLRGHSSGRSFAPKDLIWGGTIPYVFTILVLMCLDVQLPLNQVLPGSVFPMFSGEKHHVFLYFRGGSVPPDDNSSVLGALRIVGLGGVPWYYRGTPSITAVR